jgi:hypothetical protein
MNDLPDFRVPLQPGEGHKDAIHVPIVPVVASERLAPGQHVGLVSPDNSRLVGPCEEPLGIVNPFLTEPVEAGTEFWLFVYPGTIASLYHVWQHPAFARAQALEREKLFHGRS